VSLAAESLSFAYSAGRPVLRGVSFSFPPGEITAVIGPNGAGKSTLLRLLLGLLDPASGRALLDGDDVSAIPARHRARRLAYIPQRTGPAFGYSVRDYIQMGRFWHTDPAPAEDALRTLGLLPRADEPLSALSAGQQQRATLARALAQLSPADSAAPSQYILADEPVSAMDPRHSLEAMDLFRDLARRGTGIVIVLHDLALAARADRAIVIDASGQVAAAGPAAEVLTEPVLARVFAVRFERVASAAGPVLLPIGPAPAAAPVQ
jgi:iron complex transport system ATP-binding protein